MAPACPARASATKLDGGGLDGRPERQPRRRPRRRLRPGGITEQLCAALRAGEIAGYATDVTDPEPLPDGHPIWDVALITPHTANTEAMAVPLIAERVTANVRRWIAGEPLLGLVDAAEGY